MDDQANLEHGCLSDSNFVCAATTFKKQNILTGTSRRFPQSFWTVAGTII
jgi:hypothetical protein